MLPIAREHIESLLVSKRVAGLLGVVAARANVAEKDLSNSGLWRMARASQGRVIDALLGNNLSIRRVIFTAHLADFLEWAAVQNGYRLAIDQVKRTQAEASKNAESGAGISNSLHLDGLACDLLLYDLNGSYLKDSPSYETLGLQWERSYPLACWGGRFAKPDGGHFSHAFRGVK